MREITSFTDLINELTHDADVKLAIESHSTETTSEILKLISGGRSETTPEGAHKETFLKGLYDIGIY